MMNQLKSKFGFMRKEVIYSPEGQPYIKRWRILETPWFNLWLHHILMDDDDRDMHNHPWWFYSFIISGGYVEEVTEPDHTHKLENCLYRFLVCRLPFCSSTIAYRHQNQYHRVSLRHAKPCWSLILTGPKTNEWGFLTEDGWVHNQDYQKTRGT